MRTCAFGGSSWNQRAQCKTWTLKLRRVCILDLESLCSQRRATRGRHTCTCVQERSLQGEIRNSTVKLTITWLLLFFHNYLLACQFIGWPRAYLGRGISYGYLTECITYMYSDFKRMLDVMHVSNQHAYMHVCDAGSGVVDPVIIMIRSAWLMCDLSTTCELGHRRFRYWNCVIRWRVPRRM